MLEIRRIMMVSGVSALALVASVGLVVAARASTAGDVISLSPEQQPTSRLLPTGEEVRTTPVGQQTVIEMAGGSVQDLSQSRHVRVRSVGGHDYVVPDSALPTIRDDPSALSLFDVADGDGAAEAGGSSPPTATPAYQMATLTVRGIDATGATAYSGSVVVDNVDDLQRFAGMQSFGPSGQVSFSVPVGNYSIATEIATVSDEGTIVSQALVFQPEIEVTKNGLTLDMDARTATTPIVLPETPRESTFEQLAVTFARESATGLVSSVSYMTLGGEPSLYLTPTEPVSLGTVHWYTYFRLDGADETAQPYLYDLLFPWEGVVPSSQPTEVSQDALATVTVNYHSDVADHTIRTYRPSVKAWEVAPMRFSSEATAPLTRTEYVSALGDVRWANAVVWNAEENTGIDVGPWAVLEAGTGYAESSLAAPLAPGVNTTTSGDQACAACRQEDTLSLNISAWSSGGRLVSGMNTTGTLNVSTETNLYVDGEHLATSSSAPSGTVNLPGQDATLTMTLETVKNASWTTTSTRSTTEWTWRSQRRSGALPEGRICSDSSKNCVFEPLLFLSYDAGVSLTNSVTAGGTLNIGIKAVHQPFDTSASGIADSLSLDVSSDDGDTWTSASVVADGSGHFTASLPVADDAQYLSFRAHASDAGGSAIDQTIIRAVRVGSATEIRESAGGSDSGVSTVSACPEVAPPLASCFAEIQVGVAEPLTGSDPSGLSPDQLRQAYSLPEVGAPDQLVAVVDAYSNPNIEADLAVYREQYGLPECTVASGCLTIVNQDGETSPLPDPDPGWAMEIALDVDMVSAICPHCRILLVEATSNSLEDLGAAVAKAAELGADVISNSYGTSVEFAGELDYEFYYNQPGHAVVASSGDLGYSVSFPAVSRYVTAVGGTSLTQRSDGSWNESVWSGTGSGCSAYVPKPDWQYDDHCPMRMVADIAAVADPATGVAVYNTYGQDGWTVVGGTSAAAPIIAGVYALEGSGSQVTDGSAPWRNRADGLFRDVTSGSNVPSAFAATCGGDYLCTGVVGYDGPTGWGTPQGTGGLAAP